MAPRFIPNEIREMIRERTDIVELISSYITLKHMGTSWKACCPFHQEKTPSFTVSPERQSFHCFGCGAGGDVFKFVMLYENVDFTTAGIMLAERAHITIPENPRFEKKDESPLAQHKDRFYEIYEQLCSFYQTRLEKFPDSAVAKYLATRELDPDTIQKFRLGASPDAWDEGVNFLRKLGFSDEEIKLSGVVSESEKSQGRIYDRFRNRLMFPIWNEQGRVVAFSSRKVVEEDNGGKYINSPESPVFKKSKTLYGYSFARRQIPHHPEGVILCEGQLDVIAMHRAGFENAVAPQGTAFTQEQAQLLRRQTQHLAIGLDSDSAGTEATLRALDIALPLGFDVRIIRFPGGKDPDELFRKEGLEAIHGAVRSAMDFSDFLLDYYSAQFDLKTPSGRARVANSILRFVAKIENDITRATYADALSSRLKVPLDALESELLLVRAKERGNTPPRHVEGPLPAEDTPAPPQLSAEDQRLRLIEKELLGLVVEYVEAAKAVSQQIPLENFSNTPIGHAIVALVELTAAGNWAHRIQSMQDLSLTYPDAGLSTYLVPVEKPLPNAQFEKAIRQTLFAFNEAHLLKEIQQIMARWREHPEDAAQIRETYAEYQAQLRQIRLDHAKSI